MDDVGGKVFVDLAAARGGDLQIGAMTYQASIEAPKPRKDSCELPTSESKEGGS